MLKLKKEVSFETLSKYGFIEDPVNCEHPDDAYYWLNNWFYQANEEIRITISINNRGIEVLCLPKHLRLVNSFNIDVLFDLFKDGLIETVGHENKQAIYELD